MARKKTASIWDSRPISDLMPKKLGRFNAGETRSGSASNLMIGRADDNNADSYQRVLSSAFPWDNNLEEDGVTTTIDKRSFSASDLNKMGFVMHDRSMDATEIEAKEVLVGRKTGKATHIVVAGTKKDPIYELWYQKYANTSDGLEFGSPTNDMVVRTATEKKKKFIIPNNIKKIAWGEAEKLGIVSGMKHVGFGVYEASGPGGVWWKEEFTDPDTGKTQCFLVKQEGVETAKDIGETRVAAVKVAKKKNIVKKVAHKIAVTQNDKDEDNEEAKETAASKITGVGSKIVDLEDSGWKKEIDDYLKDCEDNGFKPRKIEVKVTDWEPGNA